MEARTRNGTYESRKAEGRSVNIARAIASLWAVAWGLMLITGWFIWALMIYRSDRHS